MTVAIVCNLQSLTSLRVYGPKGEHPIYMVVKLEADTFRYYIARYSGGHTTASIIKFNFPSNI